MAFIPFPGTLSIRADILEMAEGRSLHEADVGAGLDGGVGGGVLTDGAGRRSMAGIRGSLGCMSPQPPTWSATAANLIEKPSRMAMSSLIQFGPFGS